MASTRLPANFLSLPDSDKIASLNQLAPVVIDGILQSSNTAGEMFIIEVFARQSHLSDPVLQTLIYRATAEGVRVAVSKVSDSKHSVFHALLLNPCKPLSTQTLMEKLDDKTIEKILNVKSDAGLTPLGLIVDNLFQSEHDFDVHITFIRALGKNTLNVLFGMIKSREEVREYPEIQLYFVVDKHQRFFSALLRKIPEIALTDFVYLFYFEADFIVAKYPDLLNQIANSRYLKTGYSLIDVSANWLMNYYWWNILSEQTQLNSSSVQEHAFLFDQVAEKNIVKTIMEYVGNEHLYQDAKEAYAETNQGLLLTDNMLGLDKHIVDEKHFPCADSKQEPRVRAQTKSDQNRSFLPALFTVFHYKPGWLAETKSKKNESHKASKPFYKLGSN